MMEVVASGVGLAIMTCFVLFVLVFIGYLLYSFTKNKARTDIATPFNTHTQYEEFVNAIDELCKKYKLGKTFVPETIAQLSVSCVGKRELELASGVYNGRKMRVSAVIAGDAFLTQVSIEGVYKIPIDVVHKSILHVTGLGPELAYAVQKPVYDRRITIRAKNSGDTEKAGKALSNAFIKKLEALLFKKPRKFNLSSQVFEVFDKKIVFRDDVAVLRDYGLVRDEKYFITLVKEFIEVAHAWEEKR